MPSYQWPRKPLPPLAVETNYVASDFEGFEYVGAALTGSKAILRLHLSNNTTIDLPTSDDELRHLLVMLCDAFGPAAIGTSARAEVDRLASLFRGYTLFGIKAPPTGRAF